MYDSKHHQSLSSSTGIAIRTEAFKSKKQKNFMHAIITFTSPIGNDGAPQRLKSLIKLLHESEDNLLIVEAKPITNGKACIVVWHSRKNKALAKVKEHVIDITLNKILKSTLTRVPSVNALRYPSIAWMDSLSCLNEINSITAHTTRSYWLLPRNLKSKVIHIDHCDDLVVTYRNAGFSNLRKGKYFVGIIFFWEYLVEAFVDYLPSVRSKIRTFVSREDSQSAQNRVGNKDYPKILTIFNSIEFIDKPALISRPIEKSNNEIIKYLIVGNFSTVANRSILDNLINHRAFKNGFDHVYLAGLNSEAYFCEVRGNYINENIFSVGEFDDINVLANKFDVGVCLVDVQGGVQTKIFDYLKLSLVILASDNVATVFKKLLKHDNLFSSIFVGENSSRAEICESCSQIFEDISSSALRILSSRNDDCNEFNYRFAKQKNILQL